MAKINTDLVDRFAHVRLFAMDVDGVLTDGSIVLGGGIELKRFHVRDGLGLKMLAEAGVVIAWITARSSEAVRVRAGELKCVTLFEGVDDKAECLRMLSYETRIPPGDCAYMGDDLNDLPALEIVGCPLAPADAVPAVRRAACYVTRAHGGRGAVREVCDLVLEAQRLVGSTFGPIRQPAR